MNLYWLTTPDSYENWFVVAESQKKAQQFHEHAEGYGNNYATAKFVIAVPNNIHLKYKPGFRTEYWPGLDLLSELGGEIVSEDNPRIVNILGHVYKEGNCTEEIFLDNHQNEPGVYVVKVQNTNKYKIGLTNNLSKRLAQIRSSNPYNIKLVFFVKTAHYKSLEKHLHDIFKKSRGRGEWFDFSYDDLYELEMNLLFLEKEGSGMFKFYNVKSLSVHGDQY